MSQRTTNLLANGAPQQETLGTFKYLIFRKVTAACSSSLDGNDWKPVTKNDRLGPLSNCDRIFFQATAGVVASVTFDFDILPVNAQDTAQSNASTYAIGNLGIANGAAAAGGKPACTAAGFLAITDAMAFPIPGTDNGHGRQMITFAVSKNSPASLNVLDENGFTFKTMDAGDDFAYPTDAKFILSGAGGIAWVSVGQIFVRNV